MNTAKRRWPENLLTLLTLGLFLSLAVIFRRPIHGWLVLPAYQNLRLIALYLSSLDAGLRWLLLFMICALPVILGLLRPVNANSRGKPTSHHQARLSRSNQGGGSRTARDPDPALGMEITPLSKTAREKALLKDYLRDASLAPRLARHLTEILATWIGQPGRELGVDDLRQAGIEPPDFLLNHWLDRPKTRSLVAGFMDRLPHRLVLRLAPSRTDLDSLEQALRYIEEETGLHD